ncbi:MAG TPA: TetR/AcrR family transcriptional regulator [Jatrophihabitantaceae bacterium]
MPNRNRLAERREATRREILDAAWEIARAQGLGAVTLREVASRVGMQSPSLYSHFESKNAIFDAMFGQAWSDYLAVGEALDGQLPTAARKALLMLAQNFVDFCVADLARFQLMNLRVIADFEPTPESYAPSLRVMELLHVHMAELGIVKEADIDLFAAVVGGLIDGQFANEPGGRRYIGQLDRAMDMFADHVGLPGPRLRRAR